MEILGYILLIVAFAVCFGVCLYGQEEQDELADEYIRMIEEKRNHKQ